jgi:hypothetical protein
MLPGACVVKISGCGWFTPNPPTKRTNYSAQRPPTRRFLAGAEQPGVSILLPAGRFCDFDIAFMIISLLQPLVLSSYIADCFPVIRHKSGKALDSPRSLPYCHAAAAVSSDPQRLDHRQRRPAAASTALIPRSVQPLPPATLNSARRPTPSAPPMSQNPSIAAPVRAPAPPTPPTAPGRHHVPARRSSRETLAH